MNATTDPTKWLHEHAEQVEALAESDHESAVVARLALAYSRGERIDDDLAADARQLLSPPDETETEMSYVRATPTSREQPVSDAEFATAVAYLREQLATLNREQAAADREWEPVLTMWNRDTGEITFQSPTAMPEVGVETAEGEAGEERR